MTIQTVMGASLGPKLTIFCGTLSSRIRKLPRGMLGMKLPRLSSTATSTLTRLVSVWNVGKSFGIGAFLVGRDGGGGSDFFLGLATVSPASRLGPCVLVSGPSC